MSGLTHLSLFQGSSALTDLVSGLTPLSLSLDIGETDIARALILGGAPTDERDATGHAPIHTAIRKGRCI